MFSRKTDKFRHQLEICKAVTYSLFLRMEKQVMTSIVNEYKASTPIDMNIMNQSISYLTRYTSEHDSIQELDAGIQLIRIDNLCGQGRHCTNHQDHWFCY